MLIDNYAIPAIEKYLDCTTMMIYDKVDVVSINDDHNDSNDINLLQIKIL